MNTTTGACKQWGSFQLNKNKNDTFTLNQKATVDTSEKRIEERGLKKLTLTGYIERHGVKGKQHICYLTSFCKQMDY